MLQATVQRAEGYAFLARSNSNHWVVMDGSSKIGATDAAARPKEMLLFALAGCSAFDIEMILRKRRIALRDFRVEVEGDEAADPPMVFTRIRLVYRFEGDDVPAKDVERAIRLSEEKYCSVSAMVRRACPIEWRALVNGEEVAAGSSEG